MKPGRDRNLVTTALILGMAMAALEGTAVATAMPTAIADLGGVSRYSWVFSAYLLTSTTTVPLFGKLADLYGRKRVFQISVVIFLVGSGLSGAAQSMNELILFRALQGVGAGGVQPIALTLVGDIFTLEERGRMQGLFSGVWGVSSLVGPALGGLVTDWISWRWVFYLNLPVGIAAGALLQLYLREQSIRREHSLDIAGTVALTTSITLLLLALLEGSARWGLGSPVTIGCIVLAGVGLGLFVWQETRAAEPMLPLDLFRDRVIAVASAGNVVIGTLLLAASAYVPMFAQGVIGGSATDAGLTLATMSIGWPIASTISGRLLLRIGYRKLVIVGGVVAAAGCGLLTLAHGDTTRLALSLTMGVLGVGLGFKATPYLVAVQNAVPWSRRGVATSATQFFRTIGGAIAVAVFGAMLNQALGPVLGPSGDVDAALEPAMRARMGAAALARLVSGLDTGLHRIFVGFAIVALAGLVRSWFFPAGSAASLAHEEARGTVASGDRAEA